MSTPNTADIDTCPRCHTVYRGDARKHLRLVPSVDFFRRAGSSGIFCYAHCLCGEVLPLLVARGPMYVILKLATAFKLHSVIGEFVVADKQRVRLDVGTASVSVSRRDWKCLVLDGGADLDLNERLRLQTHLKNPEAPSLEPIVQPFLQVLP